MKKFVLKARDGFVRKFVPVSIAVGTACSALMVSASAEEAGGSSSVDISAVTNSLTTNLSDLATKAAVACAAVVGAGLTIFGLKWVVRKIMSFFTVIGK